MYNIKIPVSPVLAPSSLGLIVGITAGVIVLISAALLIVLVLVYVQHRLCSRTYKESDTKPQMGKFMNLQISINYDIVQFSCS